MVRASDFYNLNVINSEGGEEPCLSTCVVACLLLGNEAFVVMFKDVVF